MQETLVVAREDQARALRDSAFLAQFLEPASPSEVARRLRMAANLAHHHTRRHAALGLLVEARREGGRVYYELAARNFKHARNLLPPGDPDDRATAALRALSERFLAAHDRSAAELDPRDPDWAVVSFGRNTPDLGPPAGPQTLEARPPHLQARTLRLTADRYQALVQEVTRLLSNAETEAEPAAGVCTLAFLAFDGALEDGAHNSQLLSSFVPLEGR